MNLVESIERPHSKIANGEVIFNSELKTHEELTSQSDASSFLGASGQMTEYATSRRLEMSQDDSNSQNIVNGQTVTGNKVPSKCGTSCEELSTNDKVTGNGNFCVSTSNKETVTEATSKSEIFLNGTSSEELSKSELIINGHSSEELSTNDTVTENGILSVRTANGETVTETKTKLEVIQNGHLSKELTVDDQMTENGICTLSTVETVIDAKFKLEVIQNGHSSDQEVNNSPDERLNSSAVQLENQELSESVVSNSEVSKSVFPIKEVVMSNETIIREINESENYETKSENRKVLEKPEECKNESTNKVEQLSDTAISKESNENDTQANESEASKSLDVTLSEHVTNNEQKVSEKEVMQNDQMPTSKDLSENSKVPLASAPVKAELNAISADDIKQEAGEEVNPSNVEKENPPNVKVENPQVANVKKRRGRKSKAETFTEMAEKALEGGIMILIDV